MIGPGIGVKVPGFPMLFRAKKSHNCGYSLSCELTLVDFRDC
jgi:hypothetical protein